MAALLAAAGAAAARRAGRGGGGGGPAPGHGPCAGPDSGGDGAGGRGSTSVGNVGAAAVTAVGGGSAALGLGPHSGLGIGGGGLPDVGAPSADARAALHCFMDGGGADARAPSYAALRQEQHMLAQMQARRACSSGVPLSTAGFENGCPNLLTLWHAHQAVRSVPAAGTCLSVTKRPGDPARRATVSHVPRPRPARALKPTLSADLRVRACRPLRSCARACSRQARWPALLRPETPTASA